MQKHELLLMEKSLTDANYYISLIKDVHGNNLNVTHIKKLSQFEKLAARKKFHLILLDIYLLDCEGVQIIKKVRDLEQKSPIIVLTDTADRQLASLALTYGANDYLVKKYDDDKISKRMIEFWLRFSDKVYA